MGLRGGKGVPGEGPACVKGVSLTLGLWLRPGAPPDCWGGTWLLICHFLKVVEKDMVSRVSGVPARDKNTIPPPASSHPRFPPGVDSPRLWPLPALPGRLGRAGGVSPNGPTISTGAFRPGSWGSCRASGEEQG